MRFVLRFAGVLVLPLAILLFLQWPLREWVQAYSRQANDLGQILFALYVSVAVSAATRSHTHLSAGSASAKRRLAPWRAWAALACVGPWAVFMLWAASGMMRLSLLGLERFSETMTPGYFVIKLSLAILLLLVLVQAIASLRERVSGHGQ